MELNESVNHQLRMILDELEAPDTQPGDTPGLSDPAPGSGYDDIARDARSRRGNALGALGESFGSTPGVMRARKWRAFVLPVWGAK